MSQENVETFMRSVEAWNRGDYEAWIDHFSSDVAWFALLEVFHGHAGMRQAWESFKADLQLQARFDEIRDLGQSVLALGELQGIGHTTQLNLTGEIAQLVTLREGKITRFRDFPRHAEALEAAGLRE